MAEAVLFSLATNVLNSLAAEAAKPGGSFAYQKIRLLCGAKDKLQCLKDTIETIQAGLLDAEKQQWHNHQVKLWLKRLKDVLYDVQDLFDDVATEDLRRKVASGNKIWKEVLVFLSKSNQLAHRLKVANNIDELRKKLDRIANDNKFNFERHLRETTVAIGMRRTTHSFAREEVIIGREEDKKEIIAHLLDSSVTERVSVVSIVGIGGLGKTALAQLVYNDDKIKDYFKPKMWVCHGDPKNFDENVIIKEMLKSAKDECQGDPEMTRDMQDIENKSKEQLQQLLRKVLDGKKYLLVLDDLWNEDHQAWLDLQSLLMGGSWGSKILVTTRNLSVVRATDAKSVVHHLRGLPKEKSWDLFKKIALVDGEESLNPRLEVIGRDIVKKCAGVPLAIRTIGSLLYNTEENVWLHLREHELSEIDTSGRGIMEALKVSYDHLPSSLKHCFAYCALFPKDFVFDKRTMIQLWMAQGFIESLHKNEDLEEAGDQYVSYLLRRSFLEVEELDDSTSEVKLFKMHDLMHDLASKVAGDECKMINLNEGGIDRGTRHVSFTSESSLLRDMTIRIEATNLRTFLSLKNESTYGQEVSPIECDGIFTTIRQCRTLALPNANVCIPSSLGSQLKHLRFLDVSGNDTIESLPDSIADLLNLQTLKLSGCTSLETLPRDLKKLINLRHLLIDGCYSLTHMPCGLNNLSSLQTLSKFVVRKMDHRVPGGVGRVDELGGLNKLAGSVSLENLQFLQPAPNKSHLREKKRLHSLELRWYGQDEKSESDELVVWENLRPHQNLTHLAIYGCWGRSPPSWLSSISSLVELKLLRCGRWKYLPPLSELPSLRQLDLVELEKLEFVQEMRDPQQSNTACAFFPSLERLSLMFCGKLKGWWGGRRLLVGEEQNHWRHDSQSSFPKLLHVEISHCDNLKPLPPLSELPSLRELHLASLRELEFVEEIRDPQQSNTFFPSLETLSIFRCDKLKGWWGRRLLVGEEQNHWRYDSQSSFPKLLHLHISNCRYLKSLPLLPSVTNLDLHKSSVKVLEQQVVAVPNHSSEAALVSTSIPLSKLKNIVFYDSLDWDHSMLKTMLPFLRNLESMSFYDCSALRSLPSGMQYLSSLQHLDIGSCEELDLSSHDDEHGTQWQSLANLRTLEIYRLPKLVALPEGIQHVTSLQSLSIRWCENLMSLPKWIGNFSLLQDLEIRGCPGIECLPGGMQNLTSLKRFRIRDCPALENRCQREVGADWEKIKGIAHSLV